VSITRYMGRVGLPRTGQLVSYTDYDDGYYQKGRNTSYAARFIDPGTGVLRDRVTGLWWPKSPAKMVVGANGRVSGNLILVAAGTWSAAHGAYALGDLVQGDGAPDSLFYVCISAHTADAGKEPPNGTYWQATAWTSSAAALNYAVALAWADAITLCEGLEYAGFSDWRLPNLAEADSIGDWSAFDGAAPALLTPFVLTGTGGDYGLWWTSTTDPVTVTSAYLGPNPGGAIASTAKSNTYYVLPCRG